MLSNNSVFKKIKKNISSEKKQEEKKKRIAELEFEIEKLVSANERTVDTFTTEYRGLK